MIIIEVYNPFVKTALHRKEVSVPTRTLLEKDLIHGKILDYGCGHGYDIECLKNKGYDIVGYDKYNELYKDEELLNKKYDVIICNYVFNVINNIDEHDRLIELLRTIGNDVYISVRSDTKAVKPSWNYIKEEDCYLTPKGSYQRFYDSRKVLNYFGNVKIITDSNSLKLFKLNKK